jgi:hypothetical protein
VESEADAAVVRETAGAITGLHRRFIGYAEIFSPLHDDGIAEVLRKSTILLRIEELEDSEFEIVSPPVYGRYLMTIASKLSPDQRRFAIRHGLGHVVAGHVSEIAFLSGTRDWQTHEERVADLFALADLMPFHALDDARRSRPAWREVRGRIGRTIELFTRDWPAERTADRTSLRLDLYLETGL